MELYTEDRLVYQFYPVTSNTISFKVKASNDAHIALTTTPYESQPMYEIFFGGWGNTKSVIRKNQQQPDVVEASTPNILDPNGYRGFWIRWEYGFIMAGIQGDFNPIMKWQDTQVVPIQFFGVCTGWGGRGHWIIENTPPSNMPTPSVNPYIPAQGQVPPSAFSYPGFNPAIAGQPGMGIPQPVPGMPLPAPGNQSVPYPGTAYGMPTTAPRWIGSANGSVPPNAVAAGSDSSGEMIYIARARHEGALIPGKLVPSHRVAYVPWGGRENPKSEYEVLCDCSPRWVNNAGGTIPPGAFAAGQTENGETLYVGRSHHEGSLTPGKVQGSHRTCYIPYGGNEVAKSDYEILVL